ncbi:hypothetical protein Sru01_61470 [Sphaerisporangium rufum]|uniref:Uncharacterized protein n=1 Tax=Sphaerisporangium rufum TaxID=1381558 RepID=A0A919V8A4_9ACTN|nr:hypothetical protein [Sphaerisporangium rufum]GII81165.1 hypothetical protein Sru01_61470 [Sphaerisporangium rufum]
MNMVVRHRPALVVGLGVLSMSAAYGLGYLTPRSSAVSIRRVVVTSVDTVNRLIEFEDRGKTEILGLRPAWIDAKTKVFFNDRLPPCLASSTAGAQEPYVRMEKEVELATTQAAAADVAPDQEILVWIKC